MYYDFTVPIPKVQGKITFMPKRSIKYVQIETGRVYLPEKKYTMNLLRGSGPTFLHAYFAQRVGIQKA